MDKGAINDTHVLICPIEHYPSGMHMPASALAEAEAYLKALEACFAAQVPPQHILYMHDTHLFLGGQSLHS